MAFTPEERIELWMLDARTILGTDFTVLTSHPDADRAVHRGQRGVERPKRSVPSTPRRLTSMVSPDAARAARAHRVIEAALTRLRDLAPWLLLEYLGETDRGLHLRLWADRDVRKITIRPPKGAEGPNGVPGVPLATWYPDAEDPPARALVRALERRDRELEIPAPRLP